MRFRALRHHHLQGRRTHVVRVAYDVPRRDRLPTFGGRRVRRPTLAEEEQRRTIGLDGPDLRVKPADFNLTGSVGDRDDAVGGAEIHADCNRNHSKTALVTTHAKEKGYVSLPGELRSWQQNPWRRPEHFGNDLCRSARQTLNARVGTSLA